MEKILWIAEKESQLSQGVFPVLNGHSSDRGAGWTKHGNDWCVWLDGQPSNRRRLMTICRTICLLPARVGKFGGWKICQLFHQNNNGKFCLILANGPGSAS